MALAVLLFPEVALARQSAGCGLQQVGGYSYSMRVDSLYYRHHASGGVDYRCGDGASFLADSAVVFESSNLLQLFGDVHFWDLGTELEADRADYLSDDRELRASGNVKVTDRRNGTVIRGEQLVFNRASEFRLLDRMIVYQGDPRATVYPVYRGETPESQGEGEDASPSDSGAEAGVPGSIEGEPASPDSVPPAPYEIDAERFIVDGRKYFRARGGVVITRDSLRAVGDSLEFDQETGNMSLVGNPRVEDRRFVLTARHIAVLPSTGRDEEILARGDADLVGSTIVMRAPAIRVFLKDGQAARLVGVREIPELPGVNRDPSGDSLGLGLTPADLDRVRRLQSQSRETGALEPAAYSLSRQPSVLADNFGLMADSIDVLSPGQVLELVAAVGSARAEAVRTPAGETPEDSLDAEIIPEIARKDWMEGETIVARFLPPNPESGEVAASVNGSRLESLTSTGNARSLYRLPPSDTTPGEPVGPLALHLVAGEEITVYLDAGEVTLMEVEGQTMGYHFEPLPPAIPADSTVADADSTATPTDTSSPPRSSRRPSLPGKGESK